MWSSKKAQELGSIHSRTAASRGIGPTSEFRKCGTKAVFIAIEWKKTSTSTQRKTMISKP